MERTTEKQCCWPTVFTGDHPLSCATTFSLMRPTLAVQTDWDCHNCLIFPLSSHLLRIIFVKVWTLANQFSFPILDNLECTSHRLPIHFTDIPLLHITLIHREAITLAITRLHYFVSRSTQLYIYWWWFLINNRIMILRCTFTWGSSEKVKKHSVVGWQHSHSLRLWVTLFDSNTWKFQ